MMYSSTKKRKRSKSLDSPEINQEKKKAIVKKEIDNEGNASPIRDDISYKLFVETKGLFAPTKETALTHKKRKEELVNNHINLNKI